MIRDGRQDDDIGVDGRPPRGIHQLGVSAQHHGLIASDDVESVGLTDPDGRYRGSEWTDPTFRSAKRSENLLVLQGKVKIIRVYRMDQGLGEQIELDPCGDGQNRDWRPEQKP